MAKVFFLIGALFCALAVILGAFAAHGLKNTLDAYALGVFETAVKYQMYHGLALLILALIARSGIRLTLAGALMTAGVVLFSGSLYALALTGIKWFGPVTPLGGLCFIAGWAVFAVQVWRSKF